MWLKIKIWTKSIVFGALVIYALLFIYNNARPVKFWYWFGREPETSMLVLVFFTFFAGVILTLLVRTTLTTVRQVREARSRARTARLERDVADMKSKAAMLQTKPASPPVVDE